MSTSRIFADDATAMSLALFVVHTAPNDRQVQEAQAIADEIALRLSPEHIAIATVWAAARTKVSEN